jgi:hypothetical protein
MGLWGTFQIQTTVALHSSLGVSLIASINMMCCPYLTTLSQGVSTGNPLKTDGNLSVGGP